MNLLDILKGIENLAIELLLWIIYIPKTLYKIIKQPFWVPKYIDDELGKGEKFTNYMSPVLLYLGISVILFVLSDMIVSSNKKDFLSEVQGLKGLLFLILPLLFALTIELFRKGAFNRVAVLRGLYIQCYYLSPVMLALFAFMINDALYFHYMDLTTNDFGESIIDSVPSLLLILTILWFIIIQIKFISGDLQMNKLKAFGVFFINIFVLFLGAGYFAIISDTNIDNTLVNDPEVYEFTLNETGEYTIEIIDIQDFLLNDDNYSIALENKTDRNIALDPFGIKSTINDSQINLIHGQAISGPVGEDRPHVFRGKEGDVVQINIFIPKEASNNATELYLYKGAATDRFGGEFITSPLYLTEEDTPDVRIAEFVLPSSGQYSFTLSNLMNISEEVQFYGLALVFLNEQYYVATPEIKYNEKYEGNFTSGGDWKFSGKVGDKLKLTVNSPVVDLSFNIYKEGESIIPIHNENYVPILKWIYVLFFGYAVVLGYMAFFKKRKKEETT